MSKNGHSLQSSFLIILVSKKKIKFLITCIFIIWRKGMIDSSLIVGKLISLFFIYRLLVPVSMIICNDIMAYMFGFFFGKTPLIQLSPKKTWEGFIGGAISTVFFGFLVLIIVTPTYRYTYTLLYYI